MTALGKIAAFLLLAGQIMLAAPAAAEDVDLELVLAVDGSGSVNEQEFGLQLGGIAAAFRSPRIQRAVALGPLRKIAVALMVWSDAAFPKVHTKWYVIDSPASAEKTTSAIKTVRPPRGTRHSRRPRATPAVRTSQPRTHRHGSGRRLPTRRAGGHAR